MDTAWGPKTTGSPTPNSFISYRTNLRLKEELKAEKKSGFWDNLVLKQNIQSKKPDEIEGWEPPKLALEDISADPEDTMGGHPSWSGWEDDTKGSTKYTSLASSANSSRWSLRSAGRLVSIRRQSKGHLTDSPEEVEWGGCVASVPRRGGLLLVYHVVVESFLLEGIESTFCLYFIFGPLFHCLMNSLSHTLWLLGEHVQGLYIWLPYCRNTHQSMFCRNWRCEFLMLSHNTAVMICRLPQIIFMLLSRRSVSGLLSLFLVCSTYKCSSHAVLFFCQKITVRR